MKAYCVMCDGEFDDDERDDETCGAECEERWRAFKAEAAAAGVPPLLYAAMKIMERAEEMGITSKDIDREMASKDWFGLGGPPDRN